MKIFSLKKLMLIYVSKTLKVANKHRVCSGVLKPHQIFKAF